VKVGVVALAISPTDPNVVYVAVHDKTVGQLLGLWRTANAWGATPNWSPIATAATDPTGGSWIDYCTNNLEQMCSYDNVLSVDRSDPNIVYAGGIELWRLTYSPTASPIWTTLSRRSDGSDVVHVDQHAMAWTGTCATGDGVCFADADCNVAGKAPPCNFRLIVGNDGGVWSTTDRGATPRFPVVTARHVDRLAVETAAAGAPSPPSDTSFERRRACHRE